MTRELDDDLLQRYYDGELSPVETRSVRARVEADPKAQTRLKQLARLSEALQDVAREMGREVDADALFAGISEGIAKDAGRRGAPGRFEVITGEWVEHRRQVWVPLAAAAAIAAATLLTVMSDRTAPDASPVANATPTGADATPTETKSTPADPPSAAPEATPPEDEPSRLAGREGNVPETLHGSRVEDVDFGNNAGTVFEIETRGMTTAVVWITEMEEAP